MAEFVDRRLERSVGELEQLVRVGIFNETELRSIIAKRQRLEYAVQRHQKNVDDHLKYIQYETNLLDLIALRRKRLGYDFKFNDIEGSIGRRCHRRLMITEQKYPTDMAVWQTHVDLCQRLKWNAMASQVYTRMLQIHADKPQVWRKAIEFELNENGSPDNARELCMKSLRWHERDEELWKNHLITEMRIAAKIYERAGVLGVDNIGEDQDPITSGKVAVVVASNALKAVPSLQFGAELYGVVLSEQSSRKLREKLCSPIKEFLLGKLEELFGSEPAFWKYRAGFCLRQSDNSPTEFDLIKAEKAAFEILENAAQSHSGNPAFWKGCIEFIEELYSADLPNDWNELPRVRAEQTFRIFRTAEECCGVLELHQYLIWAKIALQRNHQQDAEQILRKAIDLEIRSTSERQRLTSLCQNANLDHKIIHDLLTDKSKNSFGKSDVDFWKIYLDWLQQNDPNLVEAAFQEGLRQSRAVVGYVAKSYVEWAYENGGMKKARKIYEKICQFPGTLTEDLVEVVIEEEKKRGTTAEFVRGVFEKALAALGSESVDLWIEFIRFEMMDKLGSPMNGSKVHWKAQRNLKPELVDLFISTYALMQNNVQ